MKLRLLIIEDNESVIGDWKEKLEFYELRENKTFDVLPVYCKTLVEAEKVLEGSKIDAAVIDIRLESETGLPNADGNTLFKEISEGTLAVTAVYTGEPEVVDLGDELIDFAKIFTKGESGGDINDILEWIDTKENMIRSVQKMNNSIHREMARLFSKSIWPRWSDWASEPDDFTNDSLKRHMATHLHATFLSDGDTHPEEYFFIPPLRNEVDTGDIFKIDDKFFILITPRCDLARDESHETLQIISLEDVSSDYRRFENGVRTAIENGSSGNSAKSNLRKLIQHKSNSSNRHFIPGFRLNGESEFCGPFLARFDDLKSIEKNSDEAINLKESRVASLSNEFVPSLVERLGNFFSRIGTPDFSHPDL